MIEQNPLNNYTLTVEHGWGPPGIWTFSDNWNTWGVTHTESIYSNIWEAYNLHVNSTFITWFHLKHNCEMRAYQASQIHPMTYLGQNHQSEATAILWGWYILVNILWGRANMPSSWSYHEVIPGSYPIHRPIIIPAINWYPTPGNVHLFYHQYLLGWKNKWCRCFKTLSM